MTRGKKKVKEYLSPSERDSLKSEVKDLEGSLRDMEGYGSGTAGEQVNKTAIKGEISRLEHAIDERTPRTPRAVEKDKYVKEEQEIENALSDGMPTWYEMNKPSKNPGAVRKHLNWLTENKVRIKRYREIQRILRPLDPKSIESLRKER